MIIATANKLSRITKPGSAILVRLTLL